MKKNILFCVATALCLTTVAQTPIYTRANLENISLSGSYVLANDIDLSGSNWTPLGGAGNNAAGFTGTFDGAGHIIYNMTSAVQDGMGLFSTIKGSATVKNVGFENAVVSGGANVRVAVVAGYLKGAATIENCYVNNSTVSGRWCIGSFVGRAVEITGAAAIRNCYSSAVISVTADSNDGNGHAGGIIGNIYNNGANTVTVENCYFSGIVKKDIQKSNAEGQVAGIVGWNGHDDVTANSIVKNNVNLAPYLLSPNGKHRISSQRDDNNDNGRGNPTPGPNYSLSTTIVSVANDWENITAVVPTTNNTHYGLDKKDGLNIPNGDANAKTQAFYAGLGWDFSSTNGVGGNSIWTINEGASYPYFSWAKDTTSFIKVPVSPISLTASSSIDLSKYIFSSRGRALTFTTSSNKVTLVGSSVSFAPSVVINTMETIYVTVQESNGSSVTTTTLQLTLVPNVMHITNRAELEAIGTNTTTLSANYVLDNDIDLSGAEWNTIQGNFTGTFDGNEHIIYNLHINKEVGGNGGLGLFYGIYGNAVVRNLGFENASVIGTGATVRVAVLAGYQEGSSVIENCYINNSVVSGRWHVGSFVGRATGANASNRAVIRNCYSSAYVYTPVYTLNADAGNAGHVGGIVGVFNNANCTVENCYFSGIVQRMPTVYNVAHGQAAGILAWNSNASNIVQNNVNLAPYIMSNNGKHRVSSIQEDGSGNDPSGPNYSLSSTIVTANYNWTNYNDIIAATGNANYGPAKKDGENIPGGDANAKAQSFYSGLGWDFASVWAITEGTSYPYFSWAKDTTSFITLPQTFIDTVTVRDGTPVDVSKYIFSGRGRALTFSSSNPKVSVTSAGVVTLVPPVPTATTVDITVQESNLTPTYTLQIALAPTASTNADLSNIIVNAGTLVPAFHPNNMHYAVSVPAGVTSITATATKDDVGASVAGDGVIDVTSTTTQTITVTAEAANQKVYTIDYLVLTAAAQDVTPLVVNNSFEYAYAGYLLSDHTRTANVDGTGDPTLKDGETAPDGWTGNAWRAAASSYQKFYGWETSIAPITVANFGTNSQGLNRDISPLDKIDGMYALWFGGNLTFPDVFELYQTIPATALPAGTYKVQVRLAVANNKRTSQRLFANQNVQYHGVATQYEQNQTEGEIATFAGWGDGEKNLQEMVVYTTIADNDSLKIGIRTSSKQGNGTTPATANPPHGWFKTDFFRVTKIADMDAADATLATLSVDGETLVPNFDPQTDSYTVTLSNGTTSVTPTATPAQPDAKVTGLETVNVSSGSGISTIVVTALDGTTTKTYTITYSTPTGTNEITVNCTWQVIDHVLTVSGVESYTVYSINGMKIADIQNNTTETSVNLLQGVYILKTLDKTYKIVVK